jgi:hypothetical protein
MAQICLILVGLVMWYFVKMELFVYWYVNLKKERIMKKLIEALYSVAKFICPKSRWGNLIYALLGAIVANYDNVESFIKAIIVIIK